jgi:hypothetical protein
LTSSDILVFSVFPCNISLPQFDGIFPVEICTFLLLLAMVSLITYVT